MANVPAAVLADANADAIAPPKNIGTMPRATKPKGIRSNQTDFF